MHQIASSVILQSISQSWWCLFGASCELKTALHSPTFQGPAKQIARAVIGKTRPYAVFCYARVLDVGTGVKPNFALAFRNIAGVHHAAHATKRR